MGKWRWIYVYIYGYVDRKYKSIAIVWDQSEDEEDIFRENSEYYRLPCRFAQEIQRHNEMNWSFFNDVSK